MAKLRCLSPALAPTRSRILSNASSSSSTHTPPTSSTQTRSATFIARPRRPYTFTQLVQLSDGSTYTMRTTSPLAMYRPAKDTRNTLLWQPSEKSLRNVELDEAGKLAAFRGRFGRGFDAVEMDEDGERKGSDDYGDLISGYVTDWSAKDPKASPPPSGKKK